MQALSLIDRSSVASAAHGDSLAIAIAASSLGHVLVAKSSRGLCAVLLGDDAEVLRNELKARLPGREWSDADRATSALAARVAELVEHPARSIDVPLDPGGSPFQRSVWEMLRAIPAGTTITYTELARRLGRPNSVRAVASACAANRLAIVIPCHRVVRSDGSLAGYRWGLERKRALLGREKPR